MKPIAARVETLEQKRVDPPPEQEPEDRGALAPWYAQQHDFARAGEVVGITESEALAEWGKAAGYFALNQAVRQQRQECNAYCRQQNAKRPKPQEIAKEEEKMQSTARLTPDRERQAWYRADKRRRPGGAAVG